MNKIARYKDLYDCNLQQLNNLLLKRKKELFNVRFQKTLGDLTNVSIISVLKKNIAQIKTEISRRRNKREK